MVILASEIFIRKLTRLIQWRGYFVHFQEQIITVLFDIKQHQNRLDEENCKLKTYFQEIDVRYIVLSFI